ncbi:hypothetical protein Pcinc_038347 [Petrolisthes cinctipes]|uniref:Uncharacterized protein n=1 Tax=Petrolisthes cinctipes TaxID=88211 RepID=A0AAE1EK52_PETCI|nr:hypothetical protein Pcinc_038347 [Petrolisthes cinctipes]
MTVKGLPRSWGRRERLPGVLNQTHARLRLQSDQFTPSFHHTNSTRPTSDQFTPSFHHTNSTRPTSDQFTPSFHHTNSTRPTSDQFTPSFHHTNSTTLMPDLGYMFRPVKTLIPQDQLQHNKVKPLEESSFPVIPGVGATYESLAFPNFDDTFAGGC